MNNVNLQIGSHVAVVFILDTYNNFLDSFQFCVGTGSLGMRLCWDWDFGHEAGFIDMCCMKALILIHSSCSPPSLPALPLL